MMTTAVHNSELQPDALRDRSYLQIVWHQFKKNGPAYWSLWIFSPLFLLTIFAPAIASNQPFVFYRDGQTLYPWMRSVFNPDEPIDFFFNMAMVGFLPWVVFALAANRYWINHNRRGPTRALGAALLFVGVTAALSILFSIPGVRPDNRYRSENFAARQQQSDGHSYGIYPPIPLGPLEVNTNLLNKPPLFRQPESTWQESNDGFVHVLGTDGRGRDVLVRMLYGSRVSMSVGFVAVTIYTLIGVVAGSLAGYFGGVVDMLISRIIEVVLLFPAFFLILTLVGMLEPSIYIIMFVIGITRWPTVGRLVRGEVLKQRSVEYTTAARALGASHLRIIFRHVLPNSLSPVLVAVPFGVANGIIIEAGLSLLGFGVRPPAPSWGSLLNEGNGNYAFWWLIIFPSIAMFLTVTLFNLVGSGLRDAMDPRLRV
jgi:peptide/nickel transport system permease protein